MSLFTDLVDNLRPLTVRSIASQMLDTVHHHVHWSTEDLLAFYAEDPGLYEYNISPVHLEQRIDDGDGISPQTLMWLALCEAVMDELWDPESDASDPETWWTEHI